MAIVKYTRDRRIYRDISDLCDYDLIIVSLLCGLFKLCIEFHRKFMVFVFLIHRGRGGREYEPTTVNDDVETRRRGF